MAMEDIGPGRKLRSTREMKQISLNDVARDTKITVSALNALEEENLSVLPKGVYTRSFIRTYSRVLGLDPEEMINDFFESCPDDIGHRAGFGGAESSLAGEYESQRVMARTAVVVAVLSIPILVFVGYLAFQETPETDELIGEEKSELIVSSPVVAVESVRPEQTTVAVDRKVISADQDLVIELAPQADCWVSAVVDGAESLSKLMRPGDREIIRFTERAVLNVGDAGVLSLKINDRLAKSLGGNGEVVTATIDRSNYQTYFLD